MNNNCPNDNCPDNNNPCEELCKCYKEAWIPRGPYNINPKWEIITKGIKMDNGNPPKNNDEGKVNGVKEEGNGEECKLYKFTLEDLCYFCDKKEDPRRIHCDNVCNGFGLRYQNFGDIPPEITFYLGKGDLDVGSNSLSVNILKFWDVSTNSVSLSEFSFIHISLQNESSTNINSPQKSFMGIYSDLTNMGIIEYKTESGGTKEVNINELDCFQLTISNLEPDQPDNVVILKNLVLTTSTEKQFHILENGLNEFYPANGSEIIAQFLWPKDGSSPAEDFTFDGQIELQGTFNDVEDSKIEIMIFKCLDNSS